MLGNPTGLDYIFYVSLLTARVLPENLATGCKHWLSFFPRNEIIGMLKVGLKQGAGTGRDCGHFCRLRCQILHVWISFPLGTIL